MILTETYLIGSLIFLLNRTQAVKVEHHISNEVRVTSGVPQVSVLGPTPFLVYINDICDLFDDLNVKCKLFADDLKLYATRPHNYNFNTDLEIAL